MPANTNGYVPLFDGGAPRIVTGYAKEAVSGGWFLGASGAAGVVSSGLDSYATTDIELFHTTGSGNFVGIALHNAASRAPVSYATRGTFLVETSGGTNLLAGTKVGCNNNDDVIYIGSAAVTVDGQVPIPLTDIGRIWTCGSDSEFVVLDLHG